MFFSDKKIREVFFVHVEALDCLYHNKKAHGLRERFTFFCDIDWKLSRFPRTKKSKNAYNLCIYSSTLLFRYVVFFIVISTAKIHVFSETAKSIIRTNCNGADEYRRRHSPIDVSVALVGFLLVGGEGRDAGGILHYYII